MGYVFDFNDALAYDSWLDSKKNKYYLDFAFKLMLDLLHPQKNQRILDIGCGTGISLEPLLNKGINLTGIDPSIYMLDLAEKKIGSKVSLHKCFAEALPFDDNEFESAFLFTSLEFVDRPAKAIEEACRVAKDTVVLCVLNRWAPLNIKRRLKSFFVPRIYTHAHFFSILELKQILFAILGDVPVKWRTTLQFPCFSGATFIEDMKIIQKSFLGTLIGIKIKPVPKFITKPMVLKIKKAKTYKPATGLATRQRQVL